MATYSISASGTHALTASTTGLQLDITTPSSIGGSGRSNPVAKYDQGLIRFSDGTSYWAPVPILGGPQFVPVPANATSFGYALLGGAVVSVVEVIGGTVFFSSPAGSLAGLSDVTIASLSNGQVLQWNSSASKWGNATPAAGGSAPALILDTALVTSDISAAGISVATWTNVGNSASFTPSAANKPVRFDLRGLIAAISVGPSASRIASALLIDSTRYLMGGTHTDLSNGRNLLSGGGTLVLDTLSAASHTVQLQVYCDLQGTTIYCRPVSLPNIEHCHLQVLEG